MNEQLRSVNETAKLTGVTVRTLHFYDEIGLLKPSHTTEAGYRMYSQDDILTLQQILFFKEIGVELKRIKEIMKDPHFDEEAALGKHREILLLKKKRIEELISLVDDRLQGSFDLSFQPFDESAIMAKQAEYRQEVIERYGHTDAFQEFEQRRAGSGDSYLELERKYKEIFGAIAEQKKSAAPPSSPAVQKLIASWQNFITESMYTCTDEILQSLGQMYVEDERFAQNINQMGEHLAEYICEAINYYCSNKGER